MERSLSDAVGKKGHYCGKVGKVLCSIHWQDNTALPPLPRHNEESRAQAFVSISKCNLKMPHLLKSSLIQIRSGQQLSG